ncbi:LysE family translocator [Pseudodesulfovibrio sediminis]|uniref:Transporter n=1 Tax=Pseudodesulfovibrio sediminis TaxID=2810563 RepID=A0ABN6ETG8_9BACT|nr:LysE family translocator [Pseudodesulfovibrio sediminis]BCS88401.1 hypothetical protein PSDVSF_16430 [Pseudodesulfovibrio sediminis]
MLGILLYCVGVMYTPGPVNILSLNSGMQHRLSAHFPFCLGVGAALCFWFLLIGYAGGAIISEQVMPFITAFGVMFILYLAYKIISADVDTNQSENSACHFTFKDGLLMQLLNPKSFLVVLPVTTVQFPAANIEGSGIAIWSMGLGLLGFGAPLAYAAFGATVTSRMSSTACFKYFNIIMGVMLVAVAMDMVYHHIYLAI